MCGCVGGGGGGVGGRYKIGKPRVHQLFVPPSQDWVKRFAPPIKGWNFFCIHTVFSIIMVKTLSSHDITTPKLVAPPFIMVTEADTGFWKGGVRVTVKY